MLQSAPQASLFGRSQYIDGENPSLKETVHS